MQNEIMYFERLNDREIIRLVQNKDESAFSELISRYKPQIWRIVLSNSRQNRDAEEIITDIWVAVWENIGGLQNEDSFGPWLQKIAYNACRRYYSSAKRNLNEVPYEDSVLVEMIDVDASPRFRENELLMQAREAVYHLPQRVRSIAIYFYLESWSMKEIANELDISLGTVKTKLREIRSLLQMEFDVQPERGDIMKSEFPQSQIQKEKFYTDKDPIMPARIQSEGEHNPSSWGLPDDALHRFGRGYIKCMAVAPDGKQLVLGTPIGLWWYDVHTLTPITLWNIDCQQITALDFSATGEWIATGHENGNVKIWDIQHGKCIMQMQRKSHFLQQRIERLIFSPDCQYLAANGVNDYVVDVWNPKTGKQLARFGCPEMRFHVCMKRHPLAFSPDNRLLACVSPPDDVKTITGGFANIDPERDHVSIFDVQTRKLVTVLYDCSDFLYGLAFSPCGEKFVAAVEDEENWTLNVWDTENWQLQSTDNSFGSNQLIPAYSRNAELKVLTFTETEAAVCDATSHEQLMTYKISHGNEIRHCYFNGSILTLATTHEISMWTLEKQIQHKVCANEHQDNAVSLVFKPDNNTLVTEYQSPEGTFLCWDYNTNTHKPNVINVAGERHCIYVSTSGKLHTTSIDGNSIVVREFGVEKPIALCPIKERPRYRAVAYAQDAHLLAYGDSNDNIFLWDIEQEKMQHTFTLHGNYATFMDFCPNGNYLACDPYSDYYRLWEVKSGREIQEFHDLNIEHVAFSPCGNFIAGEVEKEFVIWDLNAEKTKRNIPKPVEYQYWWQGGMAFSPNCLYLATGSYIRDEMECSPIFLWNTKTGENITTFTGHPAHIISLDFSPDGTTLASSSSDGTIMLWDQIL